MITDYASLQSTITDYLDRSDLSTAVTTFIGMGEARIYRDLRVRQMEKSASLTFTNGQAAIPSDYVESRNLYVTDASGNYLYELERVSPYWMREKFTLNTAQGTPKYYTREGANFILAPYPNTNYPATLLYYAKLPALSGTNTTNWLTTDYPDLIFAASMVEASAYDADAQGLQYWEQKYGIVSDGVRKADKRERMSGSPPVARPG